MTLRHLFQGGLAAAFTLACTAGFASKEVYSTSFEAPLYSPGSISGIQGWTVEGATGATAEIVNDAAFAFHGDQYVSLRNGAILDRNFEGESDLDALDMVWVEGYFRGAGSDVTLEEADYPAVDASAIVHFSSVNGIEFLDGAGDNSQPGTPVQSAVSSLDPGQWYKISIRLNFAEQAWDVWVNNEKQNESPLGFKSGGIDRLRGFTNLAQTESAFDRFRIVQPIAGDANGDTKVDAADIVALMEILATGSEDVIVQANASFDGSGIPTEADLEELKNIVLNR